MNILFIGPYKQLDEWGRKSRYLLSALKKTKHNITSRPIYFSQMSKDYIEPAEHRSFDNYDTVIQFTLASFSIYDGSFKKNIGVFNLSTVDNSFYSPTIQKINLLDEAWVDSNKIRDSLVQRENDTTIKYLNPFMDFDILNNISNDPVVERVSPRFKQCFMFYAMFGGTEEKNGVAEMLAAYYSTFSAQDEVGLALIGEGEIDPVGTDELIQTVKKSIGAVHSDDNFPPLGILNPSGYVPDEARMKIHEECDCFISTEYSLNINTVVIEATCFGNTPIINKGNEAYNILTEENSWGVESYEDSCILSKRPFPDMFTANETFCKPIVKSLSETMRKAYTDKFKRDKKKQANVLFRAMLDSDEHYKKLENILCI